MSQQQQFGRPVELDEDEYGSSELTDTDQTFDKDSCRVAIMPKGSIDASTSDLLNSSPTKHKLANNNLTGVSFVLSGRHIRMSPDQLKYISLITLTIQNAVSNLLMRAARTQKEQFSTSIAVTLTEVLKLLTCIILLWYEERGLGKAIRSIKTDIIHNYLDTLKVAVPSFVFYVQNNLLYVGSTHLDAATSQVTYQLKILTTAIFSVLLLNKKLSKTQWISLVALFIGVSLIETVAVSNHKASHSDHIDSSSQKFHQGGHSTEGQANHEKPLVGFVAILIACCLSGFAGVYFEKILKGSAQVSLWIRNIQLSVVAIPIGLIQVLVTEREHLASKGALYGFTSLTWSCILLQVMGGLLVAVVVKFANNILKGFATSLAIVISTVASIFLFDFNLTPAFIFGASLVMGSVMMYNKQ